MANGVKQLTRDQKAFLSHVPTEDSIGNQSLRRALRWGEDRYLTVRDSMVTSGLIALGRGRGGSVRLATEDAAIKRLSKPAQSPLATSEGELYPTFLKGLELWASEQGWDGRCLVRQTAHLGRKRTGGHWTRPDFSVLGVRHYRFTPGIVRDVETFEVKPASFSVVGVFEALAHARATTKSYIAIERPTDLESDVLRRAIGECERHGIGLILFPYPYPTRAEDGNGWDVKVEAVRREPDPEDLERFVGDQFSPEDGLAFETWLSR